MVKVKFIINGLCSLPGNTAALPYAVINPLYFYLKRHYLLYGTDTSLVEWLDCEYLMVTRVTDQIAQIIDEAPDVLALTVAIWNRDRQHHIAEQVKRALPNTIILFGGPEVAAHTNPDFFRTSPYVDYAVYGSGEKAFTQLLDKIVTGTPQEFINVVEQVAGNNAVVHPYEDADDKTEYWNSSVITAMADDVHAAVDSILKIGFTKGQILLSLEYTRGCMYKCTFCDWTQNLSNKVKRKKIDWKSELQFIKSLDIKARATDANFGQYPEDIEIFDYATSLYDPSKNFNFEARNVSKLKKKEAYHIITVMKNKYGVIPKVSLQDTNPQVLKNINRFEIPLETHKQHIKKFQEDTGDNKFTAELIFGLPGQSVNSICETLQTIYSMGGVCHSNQLWVFLPLSPAADPEYIKKHQVKTVKFLQLTEKNIAIDGTLAEMYERYSDLNNRDLFYPNTVAYGGESLTLCDLLTCVGINYYANETSRGNPDFYGLVPKAKANAEAFLELHTPFYEKYGFYLFIQNQHDNIYSPFCHAG